jgi:hypothetical protein
MQIKTRIRKSVAAEVYLGFIAWMLRSGLAFGQRGVYRLSDIFSSVVLPSEDPTASEGSHSCFAQDWLTGKMSRATVCAFLRKEMETVMAKYQITAFKIPGRQFRCRERRKLAKGQVLPTTTHQDCTILDLLSFEQPIVKLIRLSLRQG